MRIDNAKAIRGWNYRDSGPVTEQEEIKKPAFEVKAELTAEYKNLKFIRKHILDTQKGYPNKHIADSLITINQSMYSLKKAIEDVTEEEKEEQDLISL